MVTRLIAGFSPWKRWSLAALMAVVLAAPVVAESPGFVTSAVGSPSRANPPLPPLSQFAAQLVLDDDSVESAVGVTQGQGAKQFLWFQRFTPGTSLNLEEIWVLFSPPINIGDAVELVVYADADGNPANGAVLLTSFAGTVQANDGATFSIYPLATPEFFDGTGDLLIGVVPRFIASGVTPVNNPAAVDTTASQGRAWLAVWSADPPSPPVLTPAPDLAFDTLDTLVPGSAGNWMIRGFGSTVETVGVPALDGWGVVILAALLGVLAFWALRRRGPAALLVALLAFAAAPASAQITIDTFTTNQATSSDPPGGASSVATGGGDIIGTRRGLLVRNLAGAGPTSVGVSGGNLSLSVTATTPDSRGLAEVTWDGDSNPLALTHTGLGGVNLTASNSSGFRLAVLSATAVIELEMRVWSSAANWSRASLRIPVTGGATNFFLPYSEFIVGGGTGANFASVGAIQLFARTTEGVLTLNEVTATAPTVAATKVDTLITDVDADLRADPGDRLRYTITITNTGNEARTVNLADTVDANTTLVAGSVSATPIAKNDQYTGFGNIPISADGSPGKPGLLANDDDPDGDTVTVTAIDAASAAGGTVTLVSAATGTFNYSPPPGFSGVDSFNYTIQDDNANSATARAHISLEGVVWFVDDSNVSPPHLGTLGDPFPALTNVNGAGGAGDPDGPNDYIFVFDDDGTPYAGGLQLEAGQTLLGEGEGLVLAGTTIVPAGNRPQITNAAGVGVTLSTNNILRGFDVQASAGVGIAGASFGTLTTTNLNVLSAGGAALDLNTGNLFAAFGTLSSAGTGGQRGILLQTVTGSLNVTTTSLTNPSTHGIRVNGSPAVVLNFGTTTITDNAIGAGPTAIGIDVATGNAGASFTFGSLSVTTDAGTGLLANNSGTINIAGTGNSIVANGGPALDIVSTSLGSGATFTTLSSTDSTGDGVNLDTVTGPVVANGGAISNPSGIGFDLNAGSANVTYAGTISNTANSLLIDVTARTGGTTTFSGNLSSITSGNGINVSSNTGGAVNFSGGTKTLNTGADTAVTLLNNTGATINFTGGGLDIDTTSGSGFSATGGAAAITVQGINNSIASTTGTALNVVSTTIGAADLTFQSIASNGGANPGIVLSSTGTSGGLVVTGTGSAGSGGTIQSKTGVGISLTSTQDVSLAFMTITGSGDDGIRGSSVTGLSLNNVQVTSNGNAAGEAGIDLTDLFGSATWTSLTVSGSAEDNAVIRNSTGSLNPLTVTSSTFSNNSSIGNDGLLLVASGTASITASVTGNTFTANRGDHFQAGASNTGVLDIVFSNNTLSGGHALALGQGVTIGAATGVPGYNGTVDYNIDNNIINGSILSAITANLGTSAAGAQMRGTINGNTIGTAATFQSGSTQASGIAIDAHGNGTHTVQIANNTVRQTFDRGINVLANDGSGVLNMTVTGNNLSHSDGTNSREGFFLNNGSTDPNIFGVPDAHFVCLTLGGAGALRNTLTHGPGAPDDFRLRQRFNSTIRLPGYAGSATDTAAVVSFVNGNNISVTGSATVNSPPGGGFVGGAACPLPP